MNVSLIPDGQKVRIGEEKRAQMGQKQPLGFRKSPICMFLNQFQALNLFVWLKFFLLHVLFLLFVPIKTVFFKGTLLLQK